MLTHLILTSSVGRVICITPGAGMSSQVSLVVKNLPANAGDIGGVVPSLGWEDSPE